MARLPPEKWEEVKAVYCVGKRTLEDIGKEFGVSHVAISKRAKAEKWPKLDANLIDDAIESRSKVTKVTESYNLVASVVNSEIDRHSSDKAKLESVGMLLAEKIVEMAQVAERPSDIQALASAHKSLYEPRFKNAPDTAIQINNTNQPTRIEIE